MKISAPVVICVVTAMGLFYSQSGAQTTVSYNIATAHETNPSIAASYTGDAQSLVTATDLVHQGLSSGGFSNLGSPGHWIFSGWSFPTPDNFNAPYIQFSITVTSTIAPTSLNYSFFSGNWSDLWIGPSRLAVWVSTDDFATGTLIGSHALPGYKPFWDLPMNYADDLSSIGELVSGSKLSVRFIATWDGSGRALAPAGFVNVYPNNQNLTFSFEEGSAVPEPSTCALIAGVAGLLAAVVARRGNKRGVTAS